MHSIARFRHGHAIASGSPAEHRKCCKASACTACMAMHCLRTAKQHLALQSTCVPASSRRCMHGCQQGRVSASAAPERSCQCRIQAEKNNWYRLQRAIEIVLVTGRPTAASAWSAANPSATLYDYRPFFLFRPRIETFRRIDERVEHMVSRGRSLLAFCSL